MPGIQFPVHGLPFIPYEFHCFFNSGNPLLIARLSFLHGRMAGIQFFDFRHKLLDALIELRRAGTAVVRVGGLALEFLFQRGNLYLLDIEFTR